MRSKKKEKQQNHNGIKQAIATNRGLLMIVLFVIIFVGIYFVTLPDSSKPLVDYIALIRSQGYTPNIGMSGLYRPGTILRTKATDSDGSERVIVNPIVFAWSDECFPGLAFREAPYLLPETEGVNSAAITLGMGPVETLLPALNIKSAAVTDYHIRFENCRLISIAETDLSRNFSDTCVEGIKDSLRDGKKLAWFSVILRVIAADSFIFEINWSSGSSVESRLEVQERVQRVLTNAAGSSSGGEGILPMDAKVALKSEDSSTTVYSGTGNLIIGYDAHALQAVYGDN